jgi:hypothetical protein
MSLDPRNPLAGGLEALLDRGISYSREQKVLQSTGVFQLQGGVALANSSGYRGYSFDGSDDGVLIVNPAYNRNIAGKSDYVSLFGIAVFDGSNDSGAWVKVGFRAGDGFGVGVGGTTVDNDGTNFIGLVEGVAWVASTTAVTAGAHTFAWVTTTASSHTVYLDGKVVATSTATMRAIDSDGLGGFQIGGCWDAGGGPVRKSRVMIPMAALYSRALSVVDVVSLHNDPYQFLIPT